MNYEYKVVTRQEFPPTKQWIEKRIESDWRLVSVVPEPNGGQFDYHCYFEREVALDYPNGGSGEYQPTKLDEPISW